MWEEAVTKKIARGEKLEGLWKKIYRVIDKKRRRRVTFVLGHWRTETQSRSIVVSARGWPVVNPLGVAEPTVGWQRAPLSAVTPISEVISDKCFIYITS